ncbi:hypothetical protein LPJ64_000205 [Coemansia asiatica]|uniref:Uncharacterized protein n=1 Tax=Coemansia asiatica TaxID=1052880 RepID=A0A9W8CL31_9FUNG|nr:hypothetical protein LPJ64_000205 [Coemansia asiatica]
MVLPLNIDIKERICRAAFSNNIRIAESSKKPYQFSLLAFTFTHVDSEWRHVALKYAWHTVYVDEPAIERVLEEIQAIHGRYTRKLCIDVKFKSIVSHYRRYSLTHENADLQPFCSLSLWPQLSELEINYLHKCAFPGLASYLEPRMGTIQKLTIRGRVPIDMRRGALFLRSEYLEEIRIDALPKSDDSLSTISSHNDPLLTMSISEHITSLSLTTLIDIRIIRSVLLTARSRLSRLELSGLCPAQLATVRISHLGQDIHSSNSPRLWVRLRMLRLRLSMRQSDDDEPVQLNIDASEFPQLLSLHISDCFADKTASEYPSMVSYEQTFSKTWPQLADLHLPALSDSDAHAISQCMPELVGLSVCSACLFSAGHQISALGIWHLLTDLSRLISVVIIVSPAHNQSGSAANSEHSKFIIARAENAPFLSLNFGLIRKDHPLRVLDIPKIRLTEHQAHAIRQQCLRISEFNADVTNKKENQNASPSASALWSVAHQEGQHLFNNCIASSSSFKSIIVAQTLSFWQT